MNYSLENVFNFSSLNEVIGKNVNTTTFIKTSQYSLISSKDSAWPNFIFNVKFENASDTLLFKLSEEIDKFREKPIIFSINDHSLDNYLKSNGYLPVDIWEGMFKSILPNETFGYSSLADTSFVQSEDELQEWIDLVSLELFNGKKLAKGIFVYLLKLGNRLVYKKVAKKIVATSLIYLDENNVPGIYMVCVSKQFRGQGFGKSVLNFCLNDIQKKNGNIVVLQSTRQGINLYKSLGFSQSDRYTLFMKIK